MCVYNTWFICSRWADHLGLATMVTKGAFLAMGAAFGFAEDVNIQAGFQSVRSWRNQQISNAISAIKSARTCTGWAILLLVVAIGFTWHTPVTRPAYVVVETKDVEICGESIEGNSDVLTIKKRGVTIKEVPTKELFGLSIVKACP